jgi:hypothetical protein
VITIIIAHHSWSYCDNNLLLPSCVAVLKSMAMLLAGKIVCFKNLNILKSVIKEKMLKKFGEFITNNAGLDCILGS